jgi:hypothetical protein
MYPKSNIPEHKVYEEKVAAFVEAVNNESFVLSDIAVVLASGRRGGGL